MNTYMTSSPRTLSLLTNDDSKILGNIKPKLKKLQEQYNLQTSKFKTLNSSWTPLIDKSANRNVISSIYLREKKFILNYSKKDF